MSIWPVLNTLAILPVNLAVQRRDELSTLISTLHIVTVLQMGKEENKMLNLETFTHPMKVDCLAVISLTCNF